MDRHEVLETIERGRIIAILRGDFRGALQGIVSVLAEAGITAVEVTLNSPAALESIGIIAARFGSRMAVGAGTVLSPGDVQSAADAGARFVVSPNRDLRVIATTRDQGLVSIPGCLTPSEIVEAMDAGADVIKLFPASTFGPSYVKAVRGPLSEVRIVPTGGVTPENARAYFDHGAWAIGVGTELLGPRVLEVSGLDELRQRARAFTAINARG